MKKQLKMKTNSRNQAGTGIVESLYFISVNPHGAPHKIKGST
jgi:hypothetical protein